MAKSGSLKYPPFPLISCILYLAARLRGFKHQRLQTYAHAVVYLCVRTCVHSSDDAHLPPPPCNTVTRTAKISASSLLTKLRGCSNATVPIGTEVWICSYFTTRFKYQIVAKIPKTVDLLPWLVTRHITRLLETWKFDVNH